MRAQYPTLTRDFDLPPSIMWDALVDADLVSGWLAIAEIDARIGGRYDLVWVGSSHLEPTHGVITKLRASELLEVETSNLGLLRFALDEVFGGSRGVSTVLTLSRPVPADPAMVASADAHWCTNLDQLDALVHGRPVDWAQWDVEWGPVWKEYLDNKKVTRPL